MVKGFKLNDAVILALLCVLFFIAGNGILSLTNPDEVFYVLSAKEMAQHGSWTVPYLFDQPQFEKPVLTFWLLRLSFLMFGIGSFAARFFPAIFASIGCLAVYFFAKQAYGDQRKAFLCSLVLMSSMLFMALARFVFTDMIFSVWILLSLVSFYFAYVVPRRKALGILLFFIFSGLAVLTKGLLGISIPLSTVLVFLVFRRDWKFMWNRWSFLGGVIFLAIALPWYVFMIQKFGNAFIHEFFYNDHIRRVMEAEHEKSDTWYFYPMTLLIGMFPWSIPAAAAVFFLFKNARSGDKDPVDDFLMSWILGVFVVVQVAHSKLSSYILPVFPAIAVLTGSYLSGLIRENKNKLFLIVTAASCVLWISCLGFLFLASLGLIHFSPKYYEYVPDVHLVSAFFVLALSMVVAVVIFSLKNKTQWAVYIMALQVPLILFLGFLSRDKFEVYVSSQSVCQYLSDHAEIKNKVLCSKMFARGVRYYTGKEVAAIGDAFFSPHPIEMLDKDHLVRDFLLGQKHTYAVVRKPDFEKIEGTTMGKCDVKVLEKIGDAYILKVDVKDGVL